MATASSSQRARLGALRRRPVEGVPPGHHAGLGCAHILTRGYVPELAFMAFQMMFAAITPALIVGAFAERMRFSAVISFIILWVTFVYCPIAHMVLVLAWT